MLNLTKSKYLRRADRSLFGRPLFGTNSENDSIEYFDFYITNISMRYMAYYPNDPKHWRGTFRCEYQLYRTGYPCSDNGQLIFDKLRNDLIKKENDIIMTILLLTLGPKENLCEDVWDQITNYYKCVVY